MEIICTMSEVEVIAAISFWLAEHKGLEVKEQPVINYEPPGSSSSGKGLITATCLLGKIEKEAEDAGV